MKFEWGLVNRDLYSGENMNGLFSTIHLCDAVDIKITVQGSIAGISMRLYHKM